MNMELDGDTILSQIKRIFKRLAAISRPNCCIFNAIVSVKCDFVPQNVQLNGKSIFLEREKI